MSSPYSALAAKVRAKYPGAYDSLSDDDLGKKIVAKYPQYQSLVTTTSTTPATPPHKQSPMEMLGEGTETEAAGNAAVGQAYVNAGPKEVAGGVKDIYQGRVPQGIHRAYKGAMVTAAPAAISAGPMGLIEAPAATLTGLAASQVAKPIAKYGSRALGASDPWSDVVGDAAEVGAGYLGAKGGQAASDAVKDFASSYKLSAPEGVKLPLGLKLKRTLPPPPDTPEEMAYKTGKAQVEAKAEDAKISTRTAKTRETAFNKEASDRQAIADRATDERMAAEKKLKTAHADFARLQAQVEKARMQEITDNARMKDIQEKKIQAGHKDFAKQVSEEEDGIRKRAADRERLNNQYAEALNRRGGAAKEVEAATQAETSAHKSAQAFGRPTSSEEHLTTLIKKNILSPSEFQTLRQHFGADAMPRAGEMNTAWQSRMLGLLRSTRAARGMADVSSGPSMSSPPSP